MIFTNHGLFQKILIKGLPSGAQQTENAGLQLDDSLNSRLRAGSSHTWTEADCMQLVPNEQVEVRICPAFSNILLAVIYYMYFSFR